MNHWRVFVAVFSWSNVYYKLVKRGCCCAWLPLVKEFQDLFLNFCFKLGSHFVRPWNWPSTRNKRNLMITLAARRKSWRILEYRLKNWKYVLYVRVDWIVYWMHWHRWQIVLPIKRVSHADHYRRPFESQYTIRYGQSQPTTDPNE
jgi:hypothetical protein